MANSRNKGKAGERELCKILSEIFLGSFIRVPNSGALVGGKNVKRRQTLSTVQDRACRGDVIPPDHMPCLVIEAKSYADFPFHQLYDHCALLDSWIKQAMEVIDPHDCWFVIFKVNRKGWFIVAPAAIRWSLGSHSLYDGQYGQVSVSNATAFLKANRETILEKCR